MITGEGDSEKNAVVIYKMVTLLSGLLLKIQLSQIKQGKLAFLSQKTGRKRANQGTTPIPDNVCHSLKSG